MNPERNQLENDHLLPPTEQELLRTIQLRSSTDSEVRSARRRLENEFNYGRAKLNRLETKTVDTFDVPEREEKVILGTINFCKVDSCKGEQYTKGFCVQHYRLYSRGSITLEGELAHE